jgi:ParB-like nuclease domain
MSTTQVNEPAASSQAEDARGPAIKKSWRDNVKIHPAADLFPMMSDEELDALAADIKKNGLRHRVIVWTPPGKNENKKNLQLLDGRNRLEALERLGLQFDIDRHAHYCFTTDTDDPYAYVVSANIMRRHLTAEEKNDLIVKVLAANPAKSDREIAKAVKVDHKKVGRVRKHAEATGAVAPVEKRTGADGKVRKQPAKKPKPAESYVEVDGKKLTLAEAAKALGGHGYTVMGRGGPEEDDGEDLTVEDDLEPNEYREAFLLRAADAMAFAVYSGDVDQEVVEAAKRVVTKWQELIQAMETDPTDDGAGAPARKLEAAADEPLAGNDPGPIPAALDRTQVSA